MLQLQYLKDHRGQTQAVVVPIGLWRKIFRQDNPPVEQLSETMEEYCLNKAMDEGKKTPLLSREEALAFLEGTPE